MAEDKIKLTCAAIGRWYAYLEVEYDGLFSKYCEKNDIDEDMMSEELEQEPDECLLVDFDKEFPFLERPKLLKDQQKLIYDTITKCKDNPHITFEEVAPQFNDAFFRISKEDINNAKKVYQTQCPVLCNYGIVTDQCFLRMLAVGYKNNYDYLQHLVDDYLLDRIKHIDFEKKKEKKDGVQSIKEWKLEDWMKHNKHFKKLRNIKLIYDDDDDDDEDDGDYKAVKDKPIRKKTACDLAKAAVASFGARCVPKLQFMGLALINDSLKITCKYIESAFGFIQTLINEAAKTKRAICPFQIDLCIASNEPTIKEIPVTHPVVNDDDDDDDDDDEKKDEQSDKFVDCVDDIDKKLNHNGLEYKTIKIKLGDIKQQRVFIELFNQMEVNSDNKNDDKFYYLHKKRFVAFVDRRKSKDVNDKDPVYLYSPPANCRDIPSDAVSEWYLSASKTCLLPNMEYGDGKEAESGPKQNNANTESGDDSDAVEPKKDGDGGGDADKLKKSNIGSSFHCKAALLTLSFHCKATDEIKCYLYWNGQITRFMPEHIKTVLPLLFDMDYEGNKEFIANEAEVNGLIKRMKVNFKDKFFKAFQQSCI